MIVNAPLSSGFRWFLFLLEWGCQLHQPRGQLCPLFRCAHGLQPESPGERQHIEVDQSHREARRAQEHFHIASGAGGDISNWPSVNGLISKNCCRDKLGKHGKASALLQHHTNEQSCCKVSTSLHPWPSIHTAEGLPPCSAIFWRRGQMVFSFQVFDGHSQHDQIHGTVQVPSAKHLGESKTTTSPGPGQRGLLATSTIC